LPGSANTPDFYRMVAANAKAPDLTAAAPLMMDSETGSQWNFEGCAVSGKLKGTCLEHVDVIKDYWFDWRNYNPDTTVYRRRG